MKISYPASMTGSSNLNVTVPATGYYTGSSIKIDGYVKKCVGGMIHGSNALGVTCKIYLAISFDGTNWNYFYKSADIVSGSVPSLVVETDGLPSYIAPVLYNASGSALSGSCWARAM